MEKIKIGIVGYGNLGKGVEMAALQNPDIELRAIFTRRDPSILKTINGTVPVYKIEAADKMNDELDVMIICGGSATDLPIMTPHFAKLYNTIDSFDTHAKIPEHFTNTDNAAREGGHIAIISAGWDPGMFSINRLYAESILPQGNTYTFWGKGVSQGHSDAVRRVKGVANAIQYTIPIEASVNSVRNAEQPELSTRQRHKRECFIVPEPDADLQYIEYTVKNMPNYFSDYDTEIHFITADELKQNHSSMPHGGFVIRSGHSGGDKNHIIEYSLKLESNPEFTSSILVCCARAAYRMNKKGETGAKTMLDIPPILLSSKDPAQLREKLL